MNNRKILLILASVALAVVTSVAQNNVNSPYSRWGYGNMADRSFVGQRAMGGIGYGLRNRYIINPMNPASYSGVDSLTFQFEAGASGQFGWFEEDGAIARRLNGNLEYLALQFAILRGLGIGIGMEPFSYVGYKMGDTDTLSIGGETSGNTYSGAGGLNRLYASVGYNFLNRVSVGVKASYLYGDVIHSIVRQAALSGSYSNIITDTIRTSGVVFDIGLQYVQPIGKDRSVVAGLVYTPKQAINGAVRHWEYGVDGSGNIVDPKAGPNNSAHLGFEMPESIGLGFTFNRFNNFTLGADLLFQRWAAAKFYDRVDTLADRVKINFGGEYIPNIMSPKFFNRIRYRAGLSYSNSYINVNNAATNHQDTGFNEYGAYIGFGFPMVDRRSFLNVAFSYSRLKPDINALISEEYFKISLSYTFNELWFYKQKMK